MITFIDKFERIESRIPDDSESESFSEEYKTSYTISDLECLPVICKYIGINSQRNNYTLIKINLKLEDLNENEKQICNRISPLKYLFMENSSIIELDLSQNKFNIIALTELLSTFNGLLVEQCDLCECQFSSLEPMETFLPKTQNKMFTFI